jgi:pimeloyl-ACP methyl ester carboxylesterase
VLLHGAPASSFMFRGLIPLLAGDYHVVAPDLLGFGLSDAPTVEEFDYTFEALTDSVAALLDELGLDRYAIYVQDSGAPVGWRLALRHPGAQAATRGTELGADPVAVHARGTGSDSRRLPLIAGRSPPS